MAKQGVWMIISYYLQNCIVWKKKKVGNHKISKSCIELMLHRADVELLEFQRNRNTGC